MQLTKCLSLPWFLQAEHSTINSHSTCCRLVCLCRPPAPSSSLLHTLSSMTSARQLSLYSSVQHLHTSCGGDCKCAPKVLPSLVGPSSMTCLDQDINGTGTPCKIGVVLIVTDDFISIQDKPELAHGWLSDQITLRASLYPYQQASRSL